MSDRAVMPMEDYVSTCDKVREKAPRKTIVKNKTFYLTADNNVTEIITKGTLKLGKSYYVNYNNANMVTTSNIYEVRNIEVQGVSTKGIEMHLSHPAGDEYKAKICIYQDEENIMLYASEILDYEDYPTYITLEEITGKIVSGELAEKVDNVYEAGCMQGEREIWDSLTNNGTRKNYEKFFAGTGLEYIRPPYILRPTSNLTLAQTFQEATNLKKIEASAFDFSQKTRGTYAGAGLYYTFNGCFALEEIEDVGLQPDFAMYSTFAWDTKLRIIVRLAVDANTIYDNPFLGCYALEDITFDGVIGQNGLDFSPCTKLSKASWVNIMTKLSPFTTGLSITGSLASVKKAFETSEGANDGDTSDAWLTLCGRRDNWTISLV